MFRKKDQNGTALSKTISNCISAAKCLKNTELLEYLQSKKFTKKLTDLEKRKN